MSATQLPTPKTMQGKNSAMAEPVLKFPPEQKGAPGQAAPRDTVDRAPRRSLMAGLRRYRRFLLLVVLPIAAVIGGVVFYLNGGRYVGTDDTYVGAQKVLITPDISGRIDKVVVKEGELVHKGDVLFEIDPVPFRLAVDRAKAAVETAKTSYSNLRANIKIYDEMADLMKQAIDLKQRDVERKSALVKNSYGSQLDLDNSTNSAITVRAELAFVQQQRSSSLTQLLGNADLKLDDFPPYYQAQAALAQAERDLDHAEMRAPMDGIATLVDQIQLGRFVVAGSPVFTIIDVAKPWVDSNLKESDMTHVAVGQQVEIEVDAFPDHLFKGTVGSLSPGTGAQFAILPPQNATGNFVKVVQRIPVRIYFDENDPFVKKLKAGMSAYATIDTRHQRSLAGLFGLRSAVAKADQED
jgi:membrane fusion protein, multidrug efflux system